MIEQNGKNVDLRTMTRKEMHALCRKYVSDPVTGEAPFVYDEKTVDGIFDRCEERENWFPVVGIFSKSSEIIGFLAFKRVVYSEKRCEIGIALANPEYYGKGLGTESIRLALKAAKEILGLEKVYADAPSKNGKIIHILKKIGFMNIKTYQNYYNFGGKKDDRLEFMIRVK